MSLAYVLFVAYALAGMMTASHALTEMAGYCEAIQALLSPRVRVSLYEVRAWLFLTVAASWPFFVVLPLVVRFRRLPPSGAPVPIPMIPFGDCPCPACARLGSSGETCAIPTPQRCSGTSTDAERCSS